MNVFYKSMNKDRMSPRHRIIVGVLALLGMVSMDSCLSPPTNLNVTNITATSARFNFTPNGNSTGYYYSTTLLTPPSPMGTTPNTYKDFTGLTPNTHYYAYARAEATILFSASNWVHTDFTTLPGLEGTVTGDDSVCQNEQSIVVFTGTLGTAPYTFTYQINHGASQTVTTTTGDTAQVHVNTSTPGDYTYTLVSVEDANNQINSNRDSITVTVMSMPTATISGSDTVCVGDSPPPGVTFTGANGIPPYTFTYKVNGGAPQTLTSTGSSTSVTIPTNTVANYTYELLSVKDNSSIHCSQSQSGTVHIKINPIPSSTMTLMGNDTVCQDDPSPQITFTGANTTAPYTFTYTINRGSPQTITSTGNSATINAATDVPGTFVYKLTSIKDNSPIHCQNHTTHTVTLVVNPKPVIAWANNIAICYGDTLHLDAGNPGAQFHWSTGDTTQTIPISTAGNYSVTVTTPKGCVDSKTVSVSVNPLPDVNLGAKDTVLCRGDQIILNAGAFPAGFSYYWNTGDTTQTIQVSDSGLYYVTVTNGRDCHNADSIFIKSIHIPHLEGIRGLRENDGHTYDFSAKGLDYVATYQWDFGDGSTSTDSTPTHRYSRPGYYTVSVVVDNPCGVDSFQIKIAVKGLTGISNIKDKAEINLYPNPTKDNITLENNSKKTIKSISIFNVLSQRKSFQSVQHSNKIQLDVSGLASGLYYLKVAFKDGSTAIRKFDIDK